MSTSLLTIVDVAYYTINCIRKKNTKILSRTTKRIIPYLKGIYSFNVECIGNSGSFSGRLGAFDCLSQIQVLNSSGVRD